MTLRLLLVATLWLMLPGARCAAPQKSEETLPLALRTPPAIFDLNGAWQGCTTIDSENSAKLILKATAGLLEIRETRFQGLNCRSGSEALQTLSRYSSWNVGPFQSGVPRTLDAILDSVSIEPLRNDLASEMNSNRIFERKNWKKNLAVSLLSRDNHTGSRFAHGDIVHGIILPLPDGGMRIGLPFPLEMDAASGETSGSSAANRYNRLTELALNPASP